MEIIIYGFNNVIILAKIKPKCLRTIITPILTSHKDKK